MLLLTGSQESVRWRFGGDAVRIPQRVAQLFLYFNNKVEQTGSELLEKRSLSYICIFFFFRNKIFTLKKLINNFEKLLLFFKRYAISKGWVYCNF
jgi:hypothetical protein